MSSGNPVSESTTQPNGRKRPATKYERVAIPLPLSKSKTKTNGQVKAAVKTVADELVNGKAAQQVKLTPEDSGVSTELSMGAFESEKSNGVQTEISASNRGVDTPASNGDDIPPTTPNLTDTSKKPAQLRTQLPPDFVPSNGQPTPQTTGSSSSPAGSQVFTQAAQPAKSTGSHIIFSSDSSNNASPIPPVHNAFPLPSRQPTRHSPHASVFIPPNHAHYASEPYNPYTQRQVYPSQSFSNHHYHNSRDSTFADTTPRHHNGHAQMNNGRHLNGSQDFSSVPPGFQPYQFPGPAFARGALDNAVALGHHFAALFASEKFSDVQLQVVLEHDDSSVSMTAHKIVLARSITLYQLTKEGIEDKLLKVRVQGKWHDLRAFQEAVSWLYGCSLLGDAVTDGPFKVPGDSSSARLRYALAYISAGLFLGLPPVSQRGVDIASSLLTWDNLHIALQFALEGGLHQSWSQSNGAHADGSQVNGTSTPTNDPAATQLLYSIMDFTVASMPRDFSLDAAAPDLKELARLPEQDVAFGEQGINQSVTHKSSRSVNDPRLSRIRFGELGGPSALARTISSILYSLPFPLLSILVQHPGLGDRLGYHNLASITRAVIAEREARRARALKQIPVDATGSKRNGALYQQEMANDDNGSPSGVRLSLRHIPAA